MRPVALAALLLLGGCQAVGLAVVGTGLSIAAQSVGLLESSTALAKSWGLHLGPSGPVCPQPLLLLLPAKPAPPGAGP